MIGRPDLVPPPGSPISDADGPDRQTQRPCYNCVTRLVIGGPARILFSHLHRAINEP